MRLRSHSRRAEPRRARAFAAAAVLLAVATAAEALFAGAVRAEDAQGCAPFDEPYPSAAVSLAQARGVSPGGPDAAHAESGGGIVNLPDPPHYAPETLAGEVLLALPKDASGALPSGTKLGPGARVAGSFWSPVLCATVARVVGPEDASAEALVPEIPDTATVVPNSVYFTAQTEVAPAELPAAPAPDPYRPLQYALDQAGVERARTLSDGAGVRVAVLDSAPQAAHRDLARVRIERIEGGPGDAAAVHGTLIAGVIAATERNGFGMAGVAPGVELLAVPVCTPAGATAADRCTLYDLLRGVDRAWERRAQILNLSVVGPANPLLERAMARLERLDVLVVASAGNEATDEPRFPAAYPSVIGVGASDRDRRRLAGTHHGRSAEILAPGAEILSAVPGDAFAFGSGTSLASAQVSGVLGILLGAGLDPAAARAALFRTAATDAEGSDGPLLLPSVCDVLARAGRRCP